MASKQLSARAVATLGPGRHTDGDGLYLVVSPTGSRKWVFRFQFEGKRHDMGFGAFPAVSLADARARLAEAHRTIAAGTNPLHKRIEERTIPDFGDYANEIIEGLRPTWKSKVHARAWEMTLDVYAKPLRALRIDKVDTESVLRCLKPIWLTKSETAARTRARIEMVLDAAIASGLRTGDNPARLKGHLDKLLPTRKRLTRGHHAAMPYVDVPAFISKIRAERTVSNLALEFTILTAARSGETFGATWAEIDTGKALWTVPADRMKAGRVHEVPLNDRALAILAEARTLSRGETTDLVFPGAKHGRPLSDMAMTMALRRNGAGDFTVHGFRSSFRDWAGDCTPYPSDVAEAALAHTVRDRVEAAYRRSSALEKRRQLMQAWANFLSGSSATVISLHAPLSIAG